MGMPKRYRRSTMRGARKLRRGMPRRGRQVRLRSPNPCRNAEIRVWRCGAGAIGGRKTEVGRHPRGQRIAHARQDDGGGGLRQKRKSGGDERGIGTSALLMPLIALLRSRGIDNEYGETKTWKRGAMADIPMTFACGLYDRVLASIRRCQAARDRSQFSRHRQSARDFRSYGRWSTNSKPPKCRLPISFAATWRQLPLSPSPFSSRAFSPWPYRGRQNVDQVAETRRQTHRRAAIFDDSPIFIRGLLMHDHTSTSRA